MPNNSASSPKGFQTGLAMADPLAEDAVRSCLALPLLLILRFMSCSLSLSRKLTMDGNGDVQQPDDPRYDTIGDVSTRAFICQFQAKTAVHDTNGDHSAPKPQMPVRPISPPSMFLEISVAKVTKNGLEEEHDKDDFSDSRVRLARLKSLSTIYSRERSSELTYLPFDR